MSTDVMRDKTLALAGVFQAAALVDRLAWRGQTDSYAFGASLQSILVLDTDDPDRVFGPPGRLLLGLQALEHSLAQDNRLPDQGRILRLVLALLHLHGQVRKDSDVLSVLRRRLEELSIRYGQGDNPEEPGLIDALASTYVDTLGSLRFRIQVQGDQRHLNTTGIPERIRAALLAGIRAAWLWHRLGGRRWHLLLTRGQTLAALHAINRETYRNQ